MGRFLFALLAAALFVAGAAAISCPGAFSSISSTEYDAPTGSGGVEVDFVICGTTNKACPSSQVCPNAGCCAVCQWWCTDPTNNCGACLGTQLSVADFSTAGVAVLTYTGGDPVQGQDPPANGPRQLQMTITCGSGPMTNIGFVDPGKNPPPGRKDGDPWLYLITATSQYACGGASGGGMPGGGVFLILLLCVIVVYAAGMVVFARVTTGEFGFPHLEFWASTPGMAKDGIMFIVNKARGKEGYQSV